MKFAHKQLLAALLLAFGVAATAQPTPAPATPGASGHPHGMMDHHGRGGANMQERLQQRMAQRQAQLKQRLQITPAQEGAWTAYTTAMQPPSSMPRVDRAELAKLTTPERIDRMRALRAAHYAEMDKRDEAIKTFYAALSPEQMKVFDAQGSRSGRGGQQRGHHRGHHA